MAKFTSLQIDAKSEDEIEMTFETGDGATFTFTASVDDVETIQDALDEMFEYEEDDTEKPDAGKSSAS